MLQVLTRAVQFQVFQRASNHIRAVSWKALINVIFFTRCHCDTYNLIYIL